MSGDADPDREWWAKTLQAYADRHGETYLLIPYAESREYTGTTLYGVRERIATPSEKQRAIERFEPRKT